MTHTNKFDWKSVIDVSAIKEISAADITFNSGRVITNFKVTMENNEIHHYSFIDETSFECNGAIYRAELIELHKKCKIANDENEYILVNSISANINGNTITIGMQCESIHTDEYVSFSLKEVEELNKKFKIKDPGWRHLSYIEALRIKGTDVVWPVEQKYINQLEELGYDTSILKYTIKE